MRRRTLLGPERRDDVDAERLARGDNAGDDRRPGQQRGDHCVSRGVVRLDAEKQIRNQPR
jgi:hypothetical protein